MDEVTELRLRHAAMQAARRTALEERARLEAEVERSMSRWRVAVFVGSIAVGLLSGIGAIGTSLAMGSACVLIAVWATYDPIVRWLWGWSTTAQEDAERLAFEEEGRR